MPDLIWVQNNGAEAGQTVFHFHVHVIPRYAGGPEMVTWEPGKMASEELAETAAGLKRPYKGWFT